MKIVKKNGWLTARYFPVFGNIALKLVDTGPASGLCFRPLEPVLESPMYIIWKKYQVFTPVASLLLQELKETFGVL